VLEDRQGNSRQFEASKRGDTHTLKFKLVLRQSEGVGKPRMRVKMREDMLRLNC
jgi:hypothetical protein